MEDPGGNRLDAATTRSAGEGTRWRSDQAMDVTKVARGKKNARRQKAWIFFQHESDSHLGQPSLAQEPSHDRLPVESAQLAQSRETPRLRARPESGRDALGKHQRSGACQSLRTGSR